MFIILAQSADERPQISGGSRKSGHAWETLGCLDCDVGGWPANQKFAGIYEEVDFIKLTDYRLVTLPAPPPP
jgi:hypothetical protein